MSSYNKGMNNESNKCGNCGTTCSSCGRPWVICKQDGGCNCNKCGNIKFCEYGRMANGCIREKQPGCPMQAVIPSVTVESIEGIKNLADCLVHVADINTTFYIDDKHRPIITWAGPIDIPGYDMENNPNNYRDQIVTDTANQMAVIYDKSGNGYIFGLATELNDITLDSVLENGDTATHKTIKIVGELDSRDFSVVSESQFATQKILANGSADVQITSDGTFRIEYNPEIGNPTFLSIRVEEGTPVVSMSDDMKDAFIAALGI